MTTAWHQLSCRKRTVALLLGFVVLGWLIHLSYETGIEIRLRQKGADVWRKCGRVAGLDFDRGSTFGDADMGLVTQLGGLESLDLSFTQVTSSGLEQVRKCRRLERLSILVDQITPEQERQFKQELPLLVVDQLVIVDGWRVLKDYR